MERFAVYGEDSDARSCYTTLEVIGVDLQLIGKFIAELRKKQGLTQEQLGEELGVSNKTVSRWETGVYLPPAESLLAMSGLFGISINEILSGKRLSAEEYRAAAEENLEQAIRGGSFSLRERVRFYKKKWLREHILPMCCWAIGIIGVLVAGCVLKEMVLAPVAVLLLLLGRGWQNNAMMTYVEQHAYDGTGE